MMYKVYKRAALPKGFFANAVASGIKKSGKLDLALFYSQFPARAACLFSANTFQAAPIKVSRGYLKKNTGFRALIVNSGNANAFTGKQGTLDAVNTTRETARILGVQESSVLVASTGIIGKRLALAKIKQALPFLARGLSASGIKKAKRAILTTDTMTKEITLKFQIAGKTVTLCGIAKGAGMIAPDFACPESLDVARDKLRRGATMLCFILTDANITQQALREALATAVSRSFNCITVDGCMSTNDSIMLLANAKAANSLISTERNFGQFSKALNTVCLELAKSIVKDAEGATKFIQIKIRRAKDCKEAKKIALSIANSNLFKTAMYGENPNFGRIVAAIGASGIKVREEDLKILVSPLNRKDINVNVSIGRGKTSAIVYTSDLTPEYVRINAEYS